MLTVFSTSDFSDPCHLEWVRSFLSIWAELQAYIKQHHTTGLAWSKTVSCTFSFKVIHTSILLYILVFFFYTNTSWRRNAVAFSQPFPHLYHQRAQTQQLLRMKTLWSVRELAVWWCEWFYFYFVGLDVSGEDWLNLELQRRKLFPFLVIQGLLQWAVILSELW